MVWLVRWLLRLFFRASARWPGLFATLSLGGLGLGVWLVCLADEPQPGRGIPLWAVGLNCLGFYGFLLCLQVYKVRRGTWVEFCRHLEGEI